MLFQSVIRRKSAIPCHKLDDKVMSDSNLVKKYMIGFYTNQNKKKGIV